MIMIKRAKKPLDEQGFASLVVAMVMILVLALISVGFAQLARREQQDALFNQLSTQAYYAAESGVNDVIKGIQDGSIIYKPDGTGTPNVNTNNCLKDPLTTDDNNIISPEADVSYTCALVNLNPPTLRWSTVDDRASRDVVFSTSGAALKSLTVNWGSITGRDQPRPLTNTNLENVDDWKASNAPGVIQFSITPLGNDTGVVDRATVMANTFTAYLYPTTGAGTTTYASGLVDPPLVKGKCDTDSGTPAKLVGSYPCHVTINGFDSPGWAKPGQLFLIHFVNYYDKTDVSINQFVDGNNNPATTSDGQAVIDVTAKAKNVLKRVQVFYPLNASAEAPTDTIESGSACKQFDTRPGETVYNPLNTDASCKF
jgi:Tfp pilus assembly protein PilX